LLILSVLVPNLVSGLRARMARRREMVRSLEVAESH